MNHLSFPLFITWNITSECNLRCRHCFRTEYSCNDLSRQKINNFIELFISKGVQGIVLTGGEPLKSKYIFDILKELKNKIKVGIATNGILLNEKKINKLISYNVKDFQISLDGPSENINDYIRGKGTYNKIIKVIRMLQEKKLNVTVAMTVNSYNYEDIKNNSIKFAINNNIKKLRIEYYLPINQNDCINSISEQEMEVLCKKLRSKNIEVMFPKFNNIGCGAGIYNCILNSDLSISPCDLLTHIYKTRPIKDADDFEYLWNNDKAFINWRNKTESCLHKKGYKCVAMLEVNNE